MTHTLAPLMLTAAERALLATLTARQLLQQAERRPCAQPGLQLPLPQPVPPSGWPPARR